MRSPSVWLTACSCALVLAGCGGGATRHAAPPRLRHDVAQRLEAHTSAIVARLGAGDSCGAAAEARNLQQATTAAINAGQVPGRLLEPLQTTANDLVDRIRCTPPAPPDVMHGSDKPKEHKKGHEKGKHKKGEKDD